VGRDSSVGKATRCGLDGPGIESRWGGDFPHLSTRALGPNQPPVQRGPSISWGVKQTVRGVDHPLPSRIEVKERVELYIYCCLWAFKASSGASCTFLDVFEKLRKVTISLVVSVRPHVTTRSPLGGFSWSLIFVLFQNVSRTFKFFLSLTRITGTLHEDRYTFLIISR